jgi:hypothetical protein
LARCPSSGGICVGGGLLDRAGGNADSKKWMGHGCTTELAVAWFCIREERRPGPFWRWVLVGSVTEG